MTYDIGLILDCLNRHEIRATYKAVGDVLGIFHRSVGARLGERTPRASWVVTKTTGEPTGYSDHHKHPRLYRHSHVIETGDELRRLLRDSNPDVWLSRG